MLLEVKDVSFAYESDAQRVQVIKDLSLTLGRGEFVGVLGPSGCGKTTMLYILAGLLRPSCGSVSLNGEEIPEGSGEIGLIFQKSILFPWLTVRGNIEFPLRSLTLSPPARDERMRKFAMLVGLEDFVETYLNSLSGGMAQRAALARALVAEPKVLLMDEPFASLDAVSRLRMHDILLDVWKRLSMTIVFVTHDISEAVSLADRVIVMSHRPSSVAQEFKIPLERPRVQNGVTCAGFDEVRNHIARSARELFIPDN